MNLQPGDLLLWRVCPSAGWIDRLVGWGESKLKQVAADGYQYYHVATVSADVTQMYSAQPPKTDQYPIPDPLPGNVEVWRFKGGAVQPGLGRVFAYMDSQKGLLYPIISVLSFGLLKIGRGNFCSQLAENAWLRYPYILSPDVQFTTPDLIASSDLIERIDSVPC